MTEYPIELTKEQNRELCRLYWDAYVIKMHPKERLRRQLKIIPQSKDYTFIIPLNKLILNSSIFDIK